jgi:threonine/homoserine efflux transporter RhtA
VKKTLQYHPYSCCVFFCDISVQSGAAIAKTLFFLHLAHGHRFQRMEFLPLIVVSASLST